MIRGKVQSDIGGIMSLGEFDMKKEVNLVRGFRIAKRGVFAVWGSEAIQFLNGLVTNDVSKLTEGQCIVAAFPNAQGRLTALARICLRDSRFVIDTESATAKSLHDNLFRFTFAGDFNLEDISGSVFCVELFDDPSLLEDRPECWVLDTVLGKSIFGDTAELSEMEGFLEAEGLVKLSDCDADVRRIESGIPQFGIDADNNTVVPELGIEGLISYNKGCYIGQEIIARIHFRGHVAKILRGLIFDDLSIEPREIIGKDLLSIEGKVAGKVTSAGFSERIGRVIALAMVRYEFRGSGTELLCDGQTVRVNELPF